MRRAARRRCHGWHPARLRPPRYHACVTLSPLIACRGLRTPSTPSPLGIECSPARRSHWASACSALLCCSSSCPPCSPLSASALHTTNLVVQRLLLTFTLRWVSVSVRWSRCTTNAKRAVVDPVGRVCNGGKQGPTRPGIGQCVRHERRRPPRLAEQRGCGAARGTREPEGAHAAHDARRPSSFRVRPTTAPRPPSQLHSSTRDSALPADRGSAPPNCDAVDDFRHALLPQRCCTAPSRISR